MILKVQDPYNPAAISSFVLIDEADFDVLISLFPPLSDFMLHHPNLQDAAEHMAAYLNSHYTTAWVEPSLDSDE